MKVTSDDDPVIVLCRNQTDSYKSQLTLTISALFVHIQGSSEYFVQELKNPKTNELDSTDIFEMIRNTHTFTLTEYILYNSWY